MPIVHVRDLPGAVIAARERRAARHDRTLQQELRHLLCEIARQEPDGGALPPIELKLSDAAPETDWRRSEIYEVGGR